ncbi:polysaccharide pyruvyl transferase family protein [Microbacterium sp. 3J1]|uniref:polysaccharide pyruvyl transferase family protein n=1 Tax=Microbacterium sp. 3J1 TaxID=861269 RepID=UPI000AA87D99|nr:polysaccharide pyruvyl transferase family protein [Microbacterium sp. 3J1]
MRRVHAVGYYGWDNFGDELFRAAIQRNREVLWGKGARVRSFVAPRVLHQNLGPVGRATRIVETLLGAVWADTVALCGGSVLEDVRGTQRLRGRLQKRGQSIEALGVSLGPWRSPDARERVRKYISGMRRVVVRDSASQERFPDPVVVGGDLAALYPMPTIPREERNHLTICVSRDSRASIEDVASLLRALLADVSLPVKLLALNVRRSHGDLEWSRELGDRLSAVHGDIEVLGFETLDQTIDVIARSRAVWSQRLHGVIVAYLCDVPVLALSHHQKITDFAGDIGLPQRYLRDSLTADEETREAASRTLDGRTEWGVSPDTYRASTIDALRFDVR